MSDALRIHKAPGETLPEKDLDSGDSEGTPSEPLRPV